MHTHSHAIKYSQHEGSGVSSMWKPPIDIASVGQMPLHPHLLAADDTPLSPLSVIFPAPSVDKFSSPTGRKRTKSRDRRRSHSSGTLMQKISKFSSLGNDKQARHNGDENRMGILMSWLMRVCVYVVYVLYACVWNKIGTNAVAVPRARTGIHFASLASSCRSCDGAWFRLR